METEISKLHERLVVDIMKTGNLLENKVAILFKENGLTSIQYNILRILKGAGVEPLSVGEVKNRTLFPSSDVTRLIDRLVGKELISRNVCKENRRKTEVQITAKGLNLLNELAPKIAHRLSNFYEDFVNEKEIIAAAKVLDTIYQQSK